MASDAASPARTEELYTRLLKSFRSRIGLSIRLSRSRKSTSKTRKRANREIYWNPRPTVFDAPRQPKKEARSPKTELCRAEQINRLALSPGPG